MSVCYSRRSKKKHEEKNCVQVFYLKNNKVKMASISERRGSAGQGSAHHKETNLIISKGGKRRRYLDCPAEFVQSIIFNKVGQQKHSLAHKHREKLLLSFMEA